MTNLSSSQSPLPSAQTTAPIGALALAPLGTEVLVDPNATALKELLATYLKAADIDNVAAAYAMARIAHEGQTRDSGVAYITHPLAVATILASPSRNSSTVSPNSIDCNSPRSKKHRLKISAKCCWPWRVMSG